jgi:hypothetical protein
MINKDLLDDVFLFLVQLYSNLQPIQKVVKDPTVADVIPGKSISEMKLRVLLSQYDDLFRTELPSVNMLQNTR